MILQLHYTLLLIKSANDTKRDKRRERKKKQMFTYKSGHLASCIGFAVYSLYVFCFLQFYNYKNQTIMYVWQYSICLKIFAKYFMFKVKKVFKLCPVFFFFKNFQFLCLATKINACARAQMCMFKERKRENFCACRQ